MGTEANNTPPPDPLRITPEWPPWSEHLSSFDTCIKLKGISAATLRRWASGDDCPVDVEVFRSSRNKYRYRILPPTLVNAYRASHKDNSKNNPGNP